MGKKFGFAEFARVMGMANASISMAIKNKVLIPEANEKLIDVDREVNRNWINKQIENGRTFDLNRIYEKTINIVKIEPKQQINQEPKETLPKNDLYTKKLEAEINRTESAAKLNEIKIRKLEGQLIPYEASERVFLWAFEQFKKTLEQNAESIANIYIKILEGTQDQMVDIRNRLLDSINENFNQGIEYIKAGLENVVNEYMEERGKGEKK